MSTPKPQEPPRAWVTRSFTVVEDIIYIGLGLLLTATSVVLLATGMISFWQSLTAGALAENIVPLLDRILLILLVVELLYTVQFSFREHSLAPEPFLLVGLIAAIRRVLVLTAELAQIHKLPEQTFRFFLAELAVLTVMIVALVIALYLLRKQRGRLIGERPTEHDDG